MMQTNKPSERRSLRLFVTGIAMGTADLIPGVSGGTIAFLSGIYEELLQSIKTLSGEFLQLLISGKVKEAIGVIPFRFLLPLGLGLFTAVLFLANLMTYLLSEYPVFVWAFFFGLVVASTWIVLKRVVKWDISDKVSFVISAIVAYILVGAIPVETPTTPLYIFLSGMIAICAMILPGISGSFILLLLGKYQQILEAVTSRDVITLGTFIVGAILGLALFARVLSWLFKNHHDISIAILAGFMLGSVRKIWPWKEVISTRVNSYGEIMPLVENNVLPQTFDMSLVIAIVLALLGGVLVIYFDRLQVSNEHVQD